MPGLVRRPTFCSLPREAVPRIWYYDMTQFHVTRGRPLGLGDFDDFFARLARDADNPDRIGPQSWWRTIDEVRDSGYDLKATNPNAPDGRDLRSVEELAAIIRESQATIEAGLSRLSNIAD